MEEEKECENQYSKAYLRHLFMSNEILGKQVAAIHNLNFYNSLLKIEREKIITGEFTSWKNIVVIKLIAPKIEEAPAKCRLKIAISTAGPA